MVDDAGTPLPSNQLGSPDGCRGSCYRLLGQLDAERGELVGVEFCEHMLVMCVMMLLGTAVKPPAGEARQLRELRWRTSKACPSWSGSS